MSKSIAHLMDEIVSAKPEDMDRMRAKVQALFGSKTRLLNFKPAAADIREEIENGD